MPARGSGPRPRWVRPCLALGLGCLLPVSVLAEGLLTPLGPIAAAQQAHLIRVTAVTLIAVLPVLLGVPWILWRYRRGRGAPYRPDFAFSGPLELLMWGGPVLIVLVLGYWLWHSSQALDPYRPIGEDPVRVQVIGLDWKWLFLYPDQGVASLGTLVMPAGRPVALTLTSDTVMQSFMVPSLAGQIYAMPGMVTRLHFEANHPGTARGHNTQFNGEGFAAQSVAVRALPDADWQHWIEQARARPPLTPALYGQLAVRGTLDDARHQLGLKAGQDPVFALHDKDLFAQVVGRYHQGQPIPPSAQPGAPGYRGDVRP